MKLLELTRMYYPSVGGIEKSIYDRTKIYDYLNLDYQIISTNYSTEKYDNNHDTSKVQYLKQYTPYNVTPGLAKYLTDSYDIINVNLLGRYYSDYSIFHYAGKRQKIILTPYYIYHTQRFRFIKYILESITFPYLLSKVDAIVAFTNYEKEYWSKTYNIDPAKIFVIPPYISPFVNDDLISNDAHGDKYYLYLGRAGENKKTDLLLKAYSLLGENAISLYLTIRECDISADLLSQIKNHKKIRLLGYVTESEKNQLLRCAEAVVFPTSWESFGYVALEAGLAKKPLLCSNIPVLKETLNPSGVIYFENELESLIQALKQMSSLSQSEKLRMGEANFNNLDRYLFSESCRKYSDLFSHLLKTRYE